MHYYDSFGLLHPARVTEAGYRLYDEPSLRRLRSIMMFRELDFSLEDIKTILDNPDFNSEKALKQQIELLKLKKERIGKMISFAENLITIGVDNMDFSIFDETKQKEYAKQVKERWGNTEEYKEFEEKKINDDEMKDNYIALMSIFAEFGKLIGKKPDDAEAQALVGKLHAFINDKFYNCTKQTLAGLGMMYDAGGEMTDNINKAGGDGTARFASEAIAVYCNK